MKQIEIRITKDGSKVELDAQGFKGASCADFIGATIRALGHKDSIKKKPEYYQQNSTGIQTK